MTERLAIDADAGNRYEDFSADLGAAWGALLLLSILASDAAGQTPNLIDDQMYDMLSGDRKKLILRELLAVGYIADNNGQLAITESGIEIINQQRNTNYRKLPTRPTTKWEMW